MNEDEGFDRKDLSEGFGYAKKGLDSLEELEDKYKPIADPRTKARGRW